MSDKLDHLFANNRRWVTRATQKRPDYFSRLAAQQKPEFLWIGCSDSRVPANQVVDLAPGEIFVHRNIANVVVHSDLNCLSVIQYAVDVLHVKHIIVCGHYGCGGVKAALEGGTHGLIDNWLQHIKDVYLWHKDEIDALPTERDQVSRMCEINVIEQVANVCRSPIVQRAWQAKQELAVHGWIYAIENGLLKALNSGVNKPDQLAETTRLKQR